MVIWHPNLYKTEEAAIVEEDIKKAVEEGKFYNAHLITLAANPNEQLDIYSVFMFLQTREYKKGDPVVVGIALSDKEAKIVLETIVKDVYEETGGCNLRKYFSDSL